MNGGIGGSKCFVYKYLISIKKNSELRILMVFTLIVNYSIIKIKKAILKHLGIIDPLLNTINLLYLSIAKCKINNVFNIYNTLKNNQVHFMKRNYIYFVTIVASLASCLFFTPIHVQGVGHERLPSFEGAKITSCPLDQGTIRECIDGDVNTLARSAKVNPAWVQIEYPEKIEIYKAKVSLGQPGYYDTVYKWQVECADTQSDMDNKKNTYKLVIPEKSTSVDNVWDEMKLSVPTTKKIWKFTIKKSVGDEYIYIPEVQLLSFYQGTKLDLSTFIKNDLASVQSGSSKSQDVTKCFDDNDTSFYSTKSPSNVLVDLKESKLLINRMRFFVGVNKSSAETDRLVVEAADSIADLNAKSGTYKLVYGKGRTFKYSDWEDIYILPSLKKRYWNFYVKRVDSNANVNVSEIELWADQRYFDYPPTAPSGLKVVERKDEYSIIEWESSKDDTGKVIYHVFRDNEQIATTTNTTFKDNGLKPDKVYNYHIKSYNIIKKTSDQSESLSVEPIKAQEIAIPSGEATRASSEPINTPANISASNADIGENITSEKTDSNDNAKPTVQPDTKAIEENDSENVNIKNDNGIRNVIIIMVGAIVVIAFVSILILKNNKMKKKMIVNQKKREAELDTIKQLLIEEKADHVIELLDKKDKKG